MAELLLGKPVSDNILARAKCAVETLSFRPRLATLRIGERNDDIAYERSLRKRCENVSIDFTSVILASDSTENQMLEQIERLNADSTVNGVLLFQPLPTHLSSGLNRIRNAISSEKDVDAVSDASLSGVFLKGNGGYAPCTAKACVELLRYYQIPLRGAEIVIVGRSYVVGRPLSVMLINEDATVTVCHTRTRELETVCRRADILIAAAGTPKLIRNRHVRTGQIVLDVGIHCLDNGEMCGDVDADCVAPIVQALTPVPNGVGAVTTAVLLEQVCNAAMIRRNTIHDTITCPGH